MPADTTLTCRDCGQTFTFTTGEQGFYASRGLNNPPTRCPDCRARRKAERYSGEAYGPHGSGGHGAREMFSATCASCGKEAQVPFLPSGDRPVNCSDCFQQRGGSSRSSRSGGRGRDWAPEATAARSLRPKAAESRLLRTRDCSTLAAHGHAIVRLGALRARAAAA
jgi:CxxC-x17-CxxC domain-containing protein